MRLTRHRGQVGKQLAVERRHRELTGSAKRFFEIAAELYDDFPTNSQTRVQIEERYGVRISDKTAGFWINRGQAERRAELEGAAAA